MHEALARLAALYPHSAIRISAQQYLEGFYLKLGFTAASDVYEEDGIPHREMVKFSDEVSQIRQRSRHNLRPGVSEQDNRQCGLPVP